MMPLFLWNRAGESMCLLQKQIFRGLTMAGFHATVDENGTMKKGAENHDVYLSGGVYAA